MRLRRCLFASLLLLPLIGLVPSPASAGGAPTFIVTLRDGASPRAVAAEHRQKFGAEVTYVYEHALRGYAAKVSEGQIGALARDSRVTRVERDGVVRKSETTQANPPSWGLDRIDDRSGLDKSYTYSARGTGVTAYIIDTGIFASHEDFGGRVASTGYSAINDAHGTNDCDGHGTHVAGTVGGTTYGVAKGVTLVPVRVLDCEGSGTWSGVIAGIDWVVTQHPEGAAAVANMSLGGGANSSVDAAVTGMIQDGVSVAVAAGNGNSAGVAQDACNYSPSRVPEALTIAATDDTDTKTSWSNYGNCVDWFAPGRSITSAWHTGESATNTISGTSMATPHVAGAAALVLEGAPKASPADVRAQLWNALTSGIVGSSRSANNHLLYTQPVAASTDPAVTPSVTAAFTIGCGSTNTCEFAAVQDGSTYSWNFGDGSRSSEKSVSHTYSKSTAKYTVKLTVGGSATETKYVQCTKSGKGNKAATSCGEVAS